MREVEVKVLERSHTEMHEQLISLGASHVHDIEIEDIIFKKMSHLPHIRVLRLRKIGEDVILTIKTGEKNHAFVKSLQELEVTVSNSTTMRTILQQMGFEEKEIRKKKRYCYVLDGVHLDFDKYMLPYDFIPEFLEIEAESESAVFVVAKRLGFKQEDCLPIGFQKLKQLYMK